MGQDVAPWLEVFGRLHPAVLHAPIGLLLGWAVLELVAMVRRRPIAPEAVALLAWLAAATAVFAAVSGFVLSYEPGYDRDTVTYHMWLGISVAAASVVAAVLRSFTRTPAAYRVVLFLTVAAIVPTGHFGATMTHGEGFLTEPLREATHAAHAHAGGAARDVIHDETHRERAAVVYAIEVAPVFQARCSACHGQTKHKAGLSLHAPEGILRGSDDGLVLVAGKPEESEIVRRLRLPLDDPDHMPPEGKPQPTADEIERIVAWIAAGARFDDGAPPTGGPDSPERSRPDSLKLTASAGDAPETGAVLAVAPTQSVPTPAPAAVAALQQQLVHVEALGRGSNLLWIDFAAAAQRVTDAGVRGLLEPLREQIADLSLARSAVTDDLLAFIAELPNLRRLDLRAAPVTSAGLSRFAEHACVEELVLSRTRLSDDAVDALLRMPALRRVHIWNAGVSDEGVARLRAERPELVVITGDEPDAAVLETEGELQFSSDAPLPGQPAVAASADLLKPVNSVCPVSGKPVDANFSIVFRGRVIGFCCPNCPGQFWAEPARFESVLK
jgi:uncharacterized membrane protein